MIRMPPIAEQGGVANPGPQLVLKRGSSSIVGHSKLWVTIPGAGQSPVGVRSPAGLSTQI